MIDKPADVFVEVSKTDEPVTTNEVGSTFLDATSLWNSRTDGGKDATSQAALRFLDKWTASEGSCSELLGCEFKWTVQVGSNGAQFEPQDLVGVDVKQPTTRYSPAEVRAKVVERRESGTKTRCPIVILRDAVISYRKSINVPSASEAKVVVGEDGFGIRTSWAPRQTDHIMERVWGGSILVEDNEEGLRLSHSPRKCDIDHVNVRRGKAAVDRSRALPKRGKGADLSLSALDRNTKGIGDLSVKIKDQEIALKMHADILAVALGRRRIDRRVQAMADMERLALLTMALPTTTRFSAVELLEFLSGGLPDRNRTRWVDRQIGPTGKGGLNRVGVALQGIRSLELVSNTGNPWWIFSVENDGEDPDGRAFYRLGRARWLEQQLQGWTSTGDARRGAAFRLTGGLFWQTDTSGGLVNSLVVRFLALAERILFSGMGTGYVGVKGTKSTLPPLLHEDNADVWVPVPIQSWAHLVGLPYDEEHRPVGSNPDRKLILDALDRAIAYTTGDPSKPTTVEFRKGSERTGGAIEFRASPAFRRANHPRHKKRDLLRTITLAELLDYGRKHRVE